ncbi:glycosyltransferase family 4 protein [Nostoc sp.]|uniref:glycosyltransferase family 4 protein n=1 Tax=Nostoc sp. TaxID=1180 RepID=UPI002FFCCA42
MKSRYEAKTIHFIQPQLSHVSGGSIYNLEIVKRLEQSARGKGFFYALNSPVLELIERFNAWPSSCTFVLDGLYLTIPEFKAAVEKFSPYFQRIYLMLHYLESRNIYYSNQEKEALWTSEKLWLKAVNGIIVPSWQMRDYLSSQGIEKDKITVAFPGIEKVQVSRFSHPKKLSEDEPINLITVGTFSQGKGQLDLVQMLAQMQVKNFRLHLIGDCEQNASYTEEILAIIERSQIQDCIILHGYLPQQPMFDLFPQCDLYLSPSTYESYSMATAEAVAHGLPVLAYATGAIVDWVEDSKNGILIEPGKQEQFFKALTRLLTMRNELTQLQTNALAHIANLSFNSWDKTYQDFLQAFNKD